MVAVIEKQLQKEDVPVEVHRDVEALKGVSSSITNCVSSFKLDDLNNYTFVSSNTKASANPIKSTSGPTAMMPGILEHPFFFNFNISSSDEDENEKEEEEDLPVDSTLLNPWQPV